MFYKILSFKNIRHSNFYVLLCCLSFNITAQVKVTTIVQHDDTLIKKIYNKNWIFSVTVEPDFNKPNSNYSDSYQIKTTQYDIKTNMAQVLYFDSKGKLYSIIIKGNINDTLGKWETDFKINDSKYYVLINDMYWCIKEITEHSLALCYLTRGGEITKRYHY
jgi:hypothetical protein